MPESEWECDGTLVILTSDESEWNSAAERFPEPATNKIAIQQIAVLCKDHCTVAHSLLNYQPIGNLVVALFSDGGCRFIAEFDHVDETAKKGVVSLAHYLIDTAAGDFGKAAVSISKGVSVLIEAPFSIEQFAYAAMEPGSVVAGVFKDMKAWNSIRAIRKEFAAKGMVLLGHVGADEGYRQAALAQLAPAIVDDIRWYGFAPKSDLVFVGLKGGRYIDLIANECEVDADYEHFDPYMIQMIRKWRHATFGQLCEYAQIYENAAITVLGQCHDDNPRRLTKRLRAAISRGDLPGLQIPKLSSSPQEDLRHGILGLIQKMAGRKTFSAHGGA
ncbi:MAG: hypothetical protein WAL71_06395 [Terriglobales bacterium]